LSSLEVELDIELPADATATLRTLNDVVRCAAGVMDTSRAAGAAR
jgi:acyl carrier protein